MVTSSKFHIEDPQILGSTEQNSVATATWCPGFEHRCLEAHRNFPFFDGDLKYT
jgi:hypothetical protein